MAGVLEGIRVLDFGRYIAGPYCAALLAEHGAEVIRIEKREGSEDRFQAPVAETGEGALFLQMNRNKLGMTLDPMRARGPGDRAQAGRDRRRGGRQPAAADAQRHEARLREPEGGEARHHPDHRDRLRPRRPLQRPRRLRRHRPGHVGRGLHDGRPRTSPIARRCRGSTSARRCTAPSAPWRR